VQHNKQHNRKVLLGSFHLNGHTIGFHPHTKKLDITHHAHGSTTDSGSERVKQVFLSRDYQVIDSSPGKTNFEGLYAILLHSSWVLLPDSVLDSRRAVVVSHVLQMVSADKHFLVT